jgi:hypothetical protein
MESNAHISQDSLMLSKETTSRISFEACLNNIESNLKNPQYLNNTKIIEDYTITLHKLEKKLSPKKINRNRMIGNPKISGDNETRKTIKEISFQFRASPRTHSSSDNHPFADATIKKYKRNENRDGSLSTEEIKKLLE